MRPRETDGSWGSASVQARASVRGDETLAHVTDGIFIGVARRLDFHELGDPNRWPRIARLRAKLEAEPGVRIATSIEAGEVPGGSAAFKGHVSLPELVSTHRAKF